MESLIEVFKTLGIVGVITAAMAWLARSVITHSLLRDLEKFKSNLKAEADRQIEQFKADLGRQNLERQIVFGRLHERRADVIAELYRIGWDLAYSAQRVPLIMSPDDHFEENEHARSVRSQWLKLGEHFTGNRIYFSEKLCTLMDEFRGSVAGMLEMGRGRVESGEFGNDVEQLFKLLHAIETEFRTLVGTTASGA